MWTVRTACLLALFAAIAPGPASAQGVARPAQASPNPGSSVYNGYGNYWYPSVYPYPSIGGPGYIQYGPGGAAGYYYSTPGGSSPGQALTSTNLGGVAKAIAPRIDPPRKSANPPKPAPSRRKAP